jgi:hypothetical protein
LVPIRRAPELSPRLRLGYQSAMKPSADFAGVSLLTLVWIVGAGGQ